MDIKIDSNHDNLQISSTSLEDGEKVFIREYLPEEQQYLDLILLIAAYYFLLVGLSGGSNIDATLAIVLSILFIAIMIILHSIGLRMWPVEDKIILDLTGIQYFTNSKTVIGEWEYIKSITRLYDDEADEIVIHDSLEILTAGDQIIPIYHDVGEIDIIIQQYASNANYYTKPYPL